MGSVEQYRNDNLINIFPNPTTDKLIVRYNNPTNESQLTITNATGQIISTQPFPENGLVDVSNLSSGIYFIKYSDEHYQAVKPLSIVK